MICLSVFADNALVCFLGILLCTVTTIMPLACAVATACPFCAVLCNMSVLIALSTLIDLTLLKVVDLPQIKPLLYNDIGLFWACNPNVEGSVYPSLL